MSRGGQRSAKISRNMMMEWIGEGSVEETNQGQGMGLVGGVRKDENDQVHLLLQNFWKEK
jgi:hypothetical protein